MLVLFVFMCIGFFMKKRSILPDSADTVLARLETNVIFPALNFITMARNCTADTLYAHGINILLSTVMMIIAISVSLVVSGIIIKKESPERGVYKYALAFANSSYVGDPLILGMFGERMLSYYKMYTFPLTIGIYSWGLRCLIPKNRQRKNILYELVNPSIIALLLGIIFGLCGLSKFIPDFIISALDGLKGCMGPLAMILAGFTVASYPIAEMFKDAKIYIATLLRLIILPALLISMLFSIITVINFMCNANIGKGVLFLAFFATSAPLGLNTIIFPAAYGTDPQTGAGMALISHTLCIITIPIMYSLMVMIFGLPII